ncbi:UNVERIFIED_CONTAM: Pentatricopeptide repeat-containing protein, chloroplastic [Sesamum angustifolium]|uniref:Pentatricopeptide repeat-containing protein, chloroplastic n=1 Tax=Sesamum angustifolium TaxID=2727405 RepID=A0AAW2MB82_9LAMI
MDMRRLLVQKTAAATAAATNTAAILFLPIKRPLTVSLHPLQKPQNPKPEPQEVGSPNLEATPSAAAAAFDRSLYNKESAFSILSTANLNINHCKDLLTHFNPHQFDSIFWEIHKYVNASTALKFFYFACESCSFRFTLRSYCVLFHLLVSKNLDSGARLLLIRLIDGKLPVTLRDDVGDLHKEIANVLADTYLGSDKFRNGIKGFDILVHVYASEFKNLGFDVTMDVFRFLAARGLVPSFKTCNVLMTLLVKANEPEKSYELKKRMVDCGVKPTLVTYSVLINGLMKLEKFDEVDCILKEMLDALKLYYMLQDKGFAANKVTSNALILGLCKVGKMHEAKLLVKSMLDKGIGLDTFTYNALIYGCCKDRLEAGLKLKEEMAEKGISPDIVTYNLLMHGLCNKGKMDNALMVWHEIRRNGLVPSVNSYGVMIGGFCNVGKLEEAIQFLPYVAPAEN